MLGNDGNTNCIWSTPNNSLEAGKDNEGTRNARTIQTTALLKSAKIFKSLGQLRRIDITWCPGENTIEYGWEKLARNTMMIIMVSWLTVFYGILNLGGYLILNPVYTNMSFKRIDICRWLPPDRTWHKVNDYSGDLGERKVGHEPRLEPCWSVLLIDPLSAMWV